MGWRPALIMATAVPLSMTAAFAVVRFLGIELEQFSIASLIIVLGMVVDNAIVVSDNAVRLIRQGTPKFEAAIKGAQDLSVPMTGSNSRLARKAAPAIATTFPGRARHHLIPAS